MQWSLSTRAASKDGANTFAYIRDMLVRVSTEPVSRIRELLPDRWKAERDAANREVAVRDPRASSRTGNSFTGTFDNQVGQSYPPGGLGGRCRRHCGQGVYVARARVDTRMARGYHVEVSGRTDAEGKMRQPEHIRGGRRSRCHAG